MKPIKEMNGDELVDLIENLPREVQEEIFEMLREAVRTEPRLRAKLVKFILGKNMITEHERATLHYLYVLDAQQATKQ